MAISLVAHTFVLTATGTNAGPSPAIDTTGASLLIVGNTQNLIGGFPLPTDSKSNTWHSAVLQDAGIGAQSQICYAWGSGLSVGTGHTFSQTGGNIALVVMAFSGVLTTTDPLDQTASAASAAAASLAPGSLTPNNDNSLCVSYTGDTWTGMTTASVGTISDQSPFSVPGVFSQYATLGSYLVQTAKTAYNPLFTYAGAGFRVEALSAIFKPAPPVSSNFFFAA